jgi:hypothetical protein
VNGWGQPVIGLDPVGAKMVDTFLDQIEHGVYV